MRALAACLVMLVLAGCGGPYRQALENRQVERPQPPMTAADQRALAPYDTEMFD